VAAAGPRAAPSASHPLPPSYPSPRYQLEKFQRACKDASVPLPSAPAIAAKVDELKRYKEHVYTEEEINQIVQLKKKVRPGVECARKSEEIRQIVWLEKGRGAQESHACSASPSLFLDTISSRPMLFSDRHCPQPPGVPLASSPTRIPLAHPCYS
jgi:hypothetical protein